MNLALVPSLRLVALLQKEYAFVWRCLRRFGVLESSVDDVAQEVFLTVARKIDQVEEGKERAFLTQVALRLAANWRRGQRRRPEEGHEPEALEVAPCGNPTPEEALEAKRRRKWLDQALTELPLKLRAPFVLVTLEGLTRKEVASLLRLPEGTVATRVRSARAQFEDAVRRRAEDRQDEGSPTVAQRATADSFLRVRRDCSEETPLGGVDSPLRVKKVFG